MFAGKKILIIDDESDLCLLLKNYLLRKNYEVNVCHNLNEGKALLKKMRPDILFLDNNLPDGIGWDMAFGIAADFPGIYIILISAFHPTVPAMPANTQFRVIEKPISMAGLDRQLSDF